MKANDKQSEKKCMSEKENVYNAIQHAINADKGHSNSSKSSVTNEKLKDEIDRINMDEETRERG